MKTNRSSLRRTRTAAVVVEFAICAPILFLFFFASLEFSRVNMIRQSVENAVYEGARRGIVPGATAANCRASAQARAKLDLRQRRHDHRDAFGHHQRHARSDRRRHRAGEQQQLGFPRLLQRPEHRQPMTLRRERFETSSVP